MLSNSTILTEYCISEYGFLPKSPLMTLGGKYRIWEQIATNLPTTNKNKSTRKFIDEMPLLEVSDLSLEQCQLAYTTLTLMTHSYLWCLGSQNRSSTIPKQLAVPLVAVSNRLGIAPILTHAAVDLYNWKLINENESPHLDNLQSLYTMTGTIDESWFYLIMTAIEAIGGQILINIVKYVNKEITIDELLTTCLGCILKIIMVIKRLKEKCAPEIFFHVLRIYLNGWENGIIYEGVSEKPLSYVGGSAAQSTLIPVLDALFDIKHKNNFFTKMHKYMPEKHVKFLDYVKNNVNLEKDIKNQKSKELYDLCITELVNFRKAHLTIAHQYVFHFTGDDAKGTGGTNAKNDLTESIQETRKHNK